MKYYELYPEVAGTLHADCVIDVNTRPVAISHMHYEFDGWLGDDLLTEAGYFIVTKRLAETIKTSNLTGYDIKDCTVSKSEKFEEMYPNKPLPDFKWLVINGVFQHNDFWFSKETMMLNVSQNALDILQRHKIEACDVETTESVKKDVLSS